MLRCTTYLFSSVWTENIEESLIAVESVGLDLNLLTRRLHNWVCRYLSELLAERQNLGPFMQVLPNCSRLLNQGEY